MISLATITAFVKSPITIAVVAIVVVLGYVQWQRHDAAASARAECDAGIYKAQVDQLTQDLADARKLVDQQTARADAADRNIAQLEKDRDALTKSLPVDTTGSRKFSADYQRRLQNLKYAPSGAGK